MITYNLSHTIEIKVEKYPIEDSSLMGISDPNLNGETPDAGFGTMVDIKPQPSFH